MRTSLLPALVLLSLTVGGCPEKEAAPTTLEAPAVAPAPAQVAPPVKVAGCYQWQVEGEDPHQLRIVAAGDGFSGKYLGWEGADFVAWFQVALPKVKVVGDAVTFGFMQRDLWGDPIGMDEDLSGKESDGFSRNGWVYEGTLAKEGLTFTCAAEGAEEKCTAESGLFARVADEVCGPKPDTL